MYNSNYHYDYVNDFPEGNGWSSSHFCGEIIESKDYVFKCGKYEGRTLQQVVGRAWQGIGKYIDYGLIYIKSSVFNSLRCDEKKLCFLRVATDSKLHFSVINSATDELKSSPYDCWYQGMKFWEVAQINPDYLHGIIDRCYNSAHGEYSHYYATDNGLPISMNYIEDIIDDLSAKGVDSYFIYRLRGLAEEFKAREQEQRDWIDEQWQRENDRDLIKEGYRDAYNDDPDAQWNTY